MAGEKKYKKKNIYKEKCDFILRARKLPPTDSSQLILHWRHATLTDSARRLSLASAATTSLLARIFVLLFLFCFFVPPTNCVQNAHGAETKREAAAAEL